MKKKLFILTAVLSSILLAQESIIQTTGNITEKGNAKVYGDGLVLNDGVRAVYMSKAAIKSLQKSKNNSKLIVFNLNEKLVQEAKRKDRPKVSLVVSEIKWLKSTLKVPGARTVSCKDPKLGLIKIDLIPVRVTPKMTHFMGINYDWELAFPHRRGVAGLTYLIGPAINAMGQNGLLHAARFSSQAGDIATARRYLDQAFKLIGNKAEYEKEEKALVLKSVSLTLERAQIATQNGYLISGMQLIKNLRIPAKYSNEPEISEFLKKQKEANDEINNFLHLAKTWRSRGITGNYSYKRFQLADRLYTKFKNKNELTKDVLKALFEPWAEDLEEIEFSIATVKEGIVLATQTAEFFSKVRQLNDQSLTIKPESVRDFYLS